MSFEMKYRRLGSAGLRVSEFSYGSWVTFKNQIDLSKAKENLAVAFDHGVNFFDNAEAYAGGASEEIMGQAIQELGWSRDRFVVSSKVFWGGESVTQRGLNKKHVVDACHAALKRLRVDYLDLYFCHRPDLHTPISETVRVMNDLIRQGKILYWGTSEWSADQIAEAHAVADSFGGEGPQMEQPEYNMFNRAKVECEFDRLCKTRGLGTTIWSPLASGVLTGKYNQGIPDGSRMTLSGYEWLKKEFESDEGKAKLEKARSLEKLASAVGISMTHLSLLWTLRHENVSTVILGASNSEQLKDNLAALNFQERFSPEVEVQVEEILQNKPEPQRDYL